MYYEVTISIGKGKAFVLQGSPGWDISSGKVVIDEVTAASAIDKEHLMNWIEIHTQALEGLSSYEGRMAVLEDVRKMCQEPWIKYSYTEIMDNGVYIDAKEAAYEVDTGYPIPGFLFAEHIKGLA